jgi:hypothetical protein
MACVCTGHSHYKAPEYALLELSASYLIYKPKEYFFNVYQASQKIQCALHTTNGASCRHGIYANAGLQKKNSSWIEPHTAVACSFAIHSLSITVSCAVLRLQLMMYKQYTSNKNPIFINHLYTELQTKYSNTFLFIHTKVSGGRNLFYMAQA